MRALSADHRRIFAEFEARIAARSSGDGFFSIGMAALATNIVTFKRSRDFYMESKRQLFAGSVIRAKLLGDCVEEDEVLTFSTKVVQEKEIKLKEFNFKLLHSIFHAIKI